MAQPQIGADQQDREQDPIDRARFAEPRRDPGGERCSPIQSCVVSNAKCLPASERNGTQMTLMDLIYLIPSIGRAVSRTSFAATANKKRISIDLRSSA
jgi:hypothetical protein